MNLNQTGADRRASHSFPRRSAWLGKALWTACIRKDTRDVIPADRALQCALPPGPCSLLAETFCPAHSPPPPLLRPLLGEGCISLFPGSGRPGSIGNGLLCQRLLSTLHFLPVFGYWLLSGKPFVIMKHNFKSYYLCTSMSSPLDVCFSPAIGFWKHLKQAEKCLKNALI